MDTGFFSANEIRRIEALNQAQRRLEGLATGGTGSQAVTSLLTEAARIEEWIRNGGGIAAE